MFVHFGLDFDTQLPDPVKNRNGHVIVGPVGMLAILETQLGLSMPDVSTAKRLVQYHACLNRLNNPDRFYHQSFELPRKGTTEKSSVVQNEGGRKVRRQVSFYNLGVIISVGYKFLAGLWWFVTDQKTNDREYLVLRGGYA